jgi:hypothetical protein
MSENAGLIKKYETGVRLSPIARTIPVNEYMLKSGCSEPITREKMTFTRPDLGLKRNVHPMLSRNEGRTSIAVISEFRRVASGVSIAMLMNANINPSPVAIDDAKAANTIVLISELIKKGSSRTEK